MNGFVPVGTGLLHPIAEEDLFQLRFAVSYSQHGGSGLNITWLETLEVELGELYRLSEHLHETREEEAAAIKQALKK